MYGVSYKRLTRDKLNVDFQCLQLILVVILTSSVNLDLVKAQSLWFRESEGSKRRSDEHTSRYYEVEREGNASKI